MQKYIQIIKQSWRDKHFGYVLKGSLFTALSLFFVQGLRFMTGILIARFYGAEASGRLTLVVTVINTAAIFSNFGIRDAMQKLIPEYTSRYNRRTALHVFEKGTKYITILSIICSIILYWVSPMLCKIWNEPDMLPYFRGSAVFVVFFVLSEYFFFSLRAAFKINAANLTLVLPTVIRLLLLLLLTYYWFNINNPIFLHWITLCLLPFIFSIYPVYKNLIKPAKGEVLEQQISSNTIFNLAFPMLLTYTAFLVNNSADVFMMKMFGIDTARVGIYKSCTNISALATTLLVSLNTTVQPKFTQLYYSHNFDEIKKLMHKTSKLMFYISLPLFILLIFFAKKIMQLYGTEFTIGAGSLAILTVGQLFNTLCGPTAQLLNATGHHKQFRNMAIIAACINILLNMILIPKYDIEGAAIAGAVSMLIWNLLSVIYIKFKFGFYSGYFPFLSSK
ncbi:MAG TPA: flippase [Chitinophagales bacterium]|nr:flippase [Chitinophagales bacterium]